MYWDDDFQDWELLYEELNPGPGSVWASRGFDFRNIADYQVKAKLIGQTTLEATKTITPNYDPPELANGTVVTRDPIA